MLWNNYPPGADIGLHNSVIHSITGSGNTNFLYNFYQMGGGTSLNFSRIPHFRFRRNNVDWNARVLGAGNYRGFVFVADCSVCFLNNEGCVE